MTKKNIQIADFCRLKYSKDTKRYKHPFEKDIWVKPANLLFYKSYDWLFFALKKIQKEISKQKKRNVFETLDILSQAYQIKINSKKDIFNLIIKYIND